ncbi:MAG: aminoacyl-tRNA hydrolase [Acidaminococcaceae bacterium]|nr:aminoacyl-tRNA hydrolase [Acidaminococcaceae bacterium]MDD4721675.1 aminoacyl-tRNA hydrolase [Acidaminococcaceae bacterium]
MKLVVGLGNIGKEYVGTRHNIGFMVVEEVAHRWGESTWKKADNALYIEHRSPEKVFVIKPTTYMNLSGIAVADFVNFYHIDPSDILVIQDDLDLPCGQIRVRRKGSPGGHNGLKSIQEHLGTQEYPRIKVGISHPEHERKDVIDHVLHQFSSFERENIAEAVNRAADALEMWLKGDMDKVMQEFNKKTIKVEVL